MNNIEIEKYGHGGDLTTAQEVFGTPADEILDFSANINPLGPPETVIKQLPQFLSCVVHYPDPEHRAFKKKLAGKLNLPPENILIGSGAVECMALILAAYKPGLVGLLCPCFGEYEYLSRLQGAHIKRVFLEEESLTPDIDAVTQLIKDTDLVFLGHPNNPSGLTYSREQLLQIARLSRDNKTITVIDEAFLDFLYPEEQETLLPLLHEFPHIILIRSLTKFYAIPGLRLGYALGSSEAISRLKKLQLPWSVNGLALAAGEMCLDEEAYADSTRRLISQERHFLFNEITSFSGWKVIPGKANFLLIKLPQHITAAEIQHYLGAKGILIRNCSNYPGLSSQYIRTAVRSNAENTRLIKALRAIEGRKFPSK